MHQNLHGLAAEEKRGDAAPAMRGHGDEIAAAGTGSFDDSLERLAVEDSLTQLTQRFKKIPVQASALKPFKKR